jgi:hypothetical protein
MDQSNNVERLLRFDLVRGSKLLEEAQSTIIVFVIAFFVGSWVDRLFPLQKDPANVSNMDLIKSMALQIVLISISAYYIVKISHVIPFFFSLTSAYVPSLHNESGAGAGLALAMIFVGVQRNFQARLALAKARFYP